MTRFYLPSSGAAGASPTISAEWMHSSGIRRRMVTTKTSTAKTMMVYAPDNSSDHAGAGQAMAVQWVSDPLAAQTISAQTVTLVVAGNEPFVANNMFMAWKLFVWTAAGSVGSTVLARRQDGTELLASSTDSRVDSATTTSVAVGVGDRLVMEFGGEGTVVPATGNVEGHNAWWAWGDDAGDLAASDGVGYLTGDPWLEFANTLLFQAIGTAAPVITLSLSPVAQGTLFTAQATPSILLSVAASTYPLAQATPRITLTLGPARGTQPAQATPAISLALTPVSITKTFGAASPSISLTLAAVTLQKHVAHAAPSIRLTVDAQSIGGVTLAGSTVVELEYNASGTTLTGSQEITFREVGVSTLTLSQRE